MASPDYVFQQLLTDNQEMSAELATGLKTNQDSSWMVPGIGEDYDLQNPEQLRQVFVRNDLTDEYIAVLTEAGPSRRAMAAKIQLGLLGQAERSFRLRHCSQIRCHGHAAGRRLSHGDRAGIHTGAILSHVQDLLREPAVSTESDE